MMVAISLVACKVPQLEQRIELLQVVRTANSEMRGGCLLSPPCRKRPNVRFASSKKLGLTLKGSSRAVTRVGLSIALQMYHSYC